MLRRLADNPRYEVCASVATGTEALDAAQRFAPGAIICDYHLAGPSEGAALVSARRLLCPQSQIIVLSADTGARAAALGAGADAFLDRGTDVSSLDRLLMPAT